MFKNKTMITFLIASLILIPFLVYVFFTVEGSISTGANLSKSDWLSFTGGYLALCGSIILGAIALYQNDKLNEANKRLENLQERQLRANKGFLLPVINVPENPRKRIYEGVACKNGCLRIWLDNRGNDFIFNCKIVEIKIKNEIVRIDQKQPVSVEIKERMVFEIGFDPSKYTAEDVIDLVLKFEMTNACSSKYTETLFVSVKRHSYNIYEYQTVNFELEDCMGDE